MSFQEIVVPILQEINFIARVKLIHNNKTIQRTQLWKESKEIGVESSYFPHPHISELLWVPVCHSAVTYIVSQYQILFQDFYLPLSTLLPVSTLTPSIACFPPSLHEETDVQGPSMSAHYLLVSAKGDCHGGAHMDPVSSFISVCVNRQRMQRQAQKMLHLVHAEKLVMMGASFLRDTRNVKFSKAIAKITIIIPNKHHCANLLLCCNYQVLTLHLTLYSYKNKHHINLQYTDTHLLECATSMSH